MRKKHPFRNALLAAVGTVSGIVLLIALKPTTDPSSARAEPVITSDTAASPAPSASSRSAAESSASSKTPERKRTPPSSTASAQPSDPASAAPAPANTGNAPPAPNTTSAAPTTRTVTGATAQSKYGPVQVRITLVGSRITGAAAVRSPDETPRSNDINSTAIPKLNQETLRAQSADIDTVSGATYTSEGYRQSLQSALDRAGV
ncbi:FMN-binding protein [Streptomyces ossamyceticus]|uniref:FMN-binding protein n=1 Tax=Streptomyces ossamyceticus TaxID=249581 RepID=UPI0036EC1162